MTTTPGLNAIARSGILLVDPHLPAVEAPAPWHGHSRAVAGRRRMMAAYGVPRVLRSEEASLLRRVASARRPGHFWTRRPQYPLRWELPVESLRVE
jgi:hypothetical protein